MTAFAAVPVVMVTAVAVAVPVCTGVESVLSLCVSGSGGAVLDASCEVAERARRWWREGILRREERRVDGGWIVGVVVDVVVDVVVVGVGVEELAWL